jgi:hypothetical protein
VGKIIIIVGQSQHCQILILIFYCVKIVCWIQFRNLGFGLHVCVCLFISIVRQSKQCKWLYSLWDFKCFKIACWIQFWNLIICPDVCLFIH